MAKKQLMILFMVLIALTIFLACDSGDSEDGDSTDGDQTEDGDSDDIVDGDGVAPIDGDEVDGDGVAPIDGDDDAVDGDDDAVDGDADAVDGDDDAVDGDDDAVDGDAEADVELDAELEAETETETETEAELFLEPGDRCSNAFVIDSLPYENASHNISNYNNDLYFDDSDNSCTGYNNVGWDKIFAYTPPSNVRLDARMTSYNWDGALYILTSCTDGLQSSTGCQGDDSHAADAAEFVTFDAIGGTTYYFVADFATAAETPQSTGTFKFELRVEGSK